MRVRQLPSGQYFSSTLQRPEAFHQVWRALEHRACDVLNPTLTADHKGGASWQEAEYFDTR